jgi:4-alpha-glucanotransferase
MKRRSSGILLHITSLPSSFGIGDLGPAAYRFADFLAESKQSLWQILPLTPTDRSPYHTHAAFSTNPWLISPEILLEEGLLQEDDLHPIPDFPSDRVDFQQVRTHKGRLLDMAYSRFAAVRDPDYQRFCRRNTDWLEDYALFQALKARFEGRSWREWPPGYWDRDPQVLQAAKSELGDAIERAKVLQYLFYKQWQALRAYCNQRGIQIFGDIPIYVDYDSVDVWVHHEIFKLDESRRPYVVAGVPPDYFSATGQLWGNPVYRWDLLRERGYSWWIERIRQNLAYFDRVRIDHFRGLVAYWEVPADATTAMNGTWVEVPAMDFFNTLTKTFPCLPIVAEDLGYITADVREVMRHYELPGMKLLLFAFGADMPTNPYIPHNLPENCVAYTGTHDNNTARGWFEKEASSEEQERLFQYLGRIVPVKQLHWEMVRLVMMSAAGTAVFPIQDLLGLGEEARMNRPAGECEENWQWRLQAGALTPELAMALRSMTEVYGRD